MPWKIYRTSSCFVQRENEEQKTVLGARKHRLSGKKKVIDGKHVMTEAELIGIKEVEKMTQERKTKNKETWSWKGRTKIRSKSSDESGEEFDITDDEEVEMLDCIEVEM